MSTSATHRSVQCCGYYTDEKLRVNKLGPNLLRTANGVVMKILNHIPYICTYTIAHRANTTFFRNDEAVPPSTKRKVTPSTKSPGKTKKWSRSKRQKTKSASSKLELDRSTTQDDPKDHKNSNSRTSPYFDKSKYSDEVASQQAELPRLSLSGRLKRKSHKHLQYPDFVPPKSPHGLIQEQFYSEPWKLLVATIFLNRTTGREIILLCWSGNFL